LAEFIPHREHAEFLSSDSQDQINHNSINGINLFQELDFSVRLWNIISEAGYSQNLVRFFELPRTEMMKLRGFGQKSLVEVEELVQKISRLPLNVQTRAPDQSFPSQDQINHNSINDINLFQELDFSVRLWNIISQAGYSQNLIGFFELPRAEMMKFRGFGQKCLTEVDAIVQRIHASQDGSLFFTLNQPVDLLSEPNITLYDFLCSKNKLPDHKFRAELLSSHFAHKKISIPKDCRNIKTLNIKKFIDPKDTQMSKGLKRIINRFDTLSQIHNLSIEEFLMMKGVGIKSGKAFLLWYATLHIGSYEELIDNLEEYANSKILCSEYLESRLKRMGIIYVRDLLTLENSEDFRMSKLAHLELRTIKLDSKNGKVTSSANFLSSQDIFGRIAEFFDTVLDERSKTFVLNRYLSSGANLTSLEDVGSEYDLTRERVRQIIERTILSFKRRYIISEPFFLRKIKRVILKKKAPLQAVDFCPNEASVQDELTPFFLNFISDLFPAIPITDRLLVASSKKLNNCLDSLAQLMKDVNELKIEEYLGYDEKSPEIDLLKLHAVFSSQKYELAGDSNNIIVRKSALSLSEALLSCVVEYDRPVSIEEIVFYLGSLKSYTKQSHRIYQDQKKKRGIGGTSIFSRLISHDKIVRIEKYTFGMTSHISYPISAWPAIGKSAAKLLDGDERQYSAAYLYYQLKKSYPLLRSRYELDTILQRCDSICYLGYQTYVSLSVDDASRVTLRELITTILTNSASPITIQKLLDEIENVRTIRREGIFSVLAQYPEIRNYFNQFVSISDDPTADLKFITWTPEFIYRLLKEQYPHTEWSQVVNSIDHLEEAGNDYLEHVMSLEKIQYHKTHDSIWFVSSEFYPIQKAIVIICAEQREMYLEEILIHLRDSFNEEILERDRFKKRLESHVYIHKNHDGRYAFLDPDQLKKKYMDLLNQIEEFLSREGTTISQGDLIKKFSNDHEIIKEQPENMIDIIKSDDRFTVLGEDLICLL
jgi:hypothetical protein